MKDYIIPSIDSSSLVTELTSYVSGDGKTLLGKGLVEITSDMIAAIPSLETAFSELNLSVKEISLELLIAFSPFFAFAAKQPGLMMPLQSPGINLIFYDVPEGTPFADKTLPDQLDAYYASDLSVNEEMEFSAPIMINTDACCTAFITQEPIVIVTFSFNEDVSDLFN